MVAVNESDENESPEKTEQKIEQSRQGQRASLALEVPVEPMATFLKVVVLQHPQEPDKILGTAALLVRALKNSELKVGLSWSSLSKACGPTAIPSEWGVLYLGPKMEGPQKAVTFFGKSKTPKPDPVAGQLKGLIVLDGTWSQAKALWWRNAWLLKLTRVVLNPSAPSKYGRLRREPRKEAVSTIEAVAQVLDVLEPKGAEVRVHLDSAFEEMLRAYRKS